METLIFKTLVNLIRSFPGGSVVKNLLANVGNSGDMGSILSGQDCGSGRRPRGEHGDPLQCSCLKNPMDRGTWRAALHKVMKSWTQLNTYPYTVILLRGVCIQKKTFLTEIHNWNNWIFIHGLIGNIPRKSLHRLSHNIIFWNRIYLEINAVAFYFTFIQCLFSKEVRGFFWWSSG